MYEEKERKLVVRLQLKMQSELQSFGNEDAVMVYLNTLIALLAVCCNRADVFLAVMSVTSIVRLLFQYELVIEFR